MKSCTAAVAPSSTSNLGPGYDVFGLALGPLEDSGHDHPGIGQHETDNHQHVGASL